MRGRVRRHDHLVAVHVYSRRAGPRDVGRHGEEAEVAAQEPRHDGVNEWVVKQVEELVAFVGEVPVLVVSHQHLYRSSKPKTNQKENKGS